MFFKRKKGSRLSRKALTALVFTGIFMDKETVDRQLIEKGYIVEVPHGDKIMRCFTTKGLHAVMKLKGLT